MAAGEQAPVLVQAPEHPVSQLQGPFEESMRESAEEVPQSDEPLDAAGRRAVLLEKPFYERVIAGRWKQKKGERYHPLWKLIAQLSFGIHLLSQSMAVSEDDVMQILQSHVDDIDVFLERTTEDFEVAQEDIQERYRCLKLPLAHPGVFDRMLEDRTFRNSIVEGNEKIEHIVSRTGDATRDTLKDVQKGFDATSALEKYLQGLDTTWDRQTAEHEAVFVAMLGNVDGWRRTFSDLHLRGNKLTGSLKKLTDVVNEMQLRAADVSRKQLKQMQAAQGGITSQYSTQHESNRRISQNQKVNGFKPLPTEPGRNTSHSFRNSNTIHGHNQSSSGGSRGSRDRTQRSVVSSRDSKKPGDKSGVPQLVTIKASPKSQSPSREEQSSLKRQQVKASSTPVELAAEVPTDALRNAPMSNKNRLSIGLGILPGERRWKTVSKAYSPSTALIELLKSQMEPSNRKKSSETPEHNQSEQAKRTPQTRASNAGSDYFSAHEQPTQESQKRKPTPLTLTPNVEQRIESPPHTPAWASPTFGTAERERAMISKIALMSHPPDADLADAPGPSATNTPNSHQHSSQNKSYSSSLGEPGPEVPGTPDGPGPQLRDTPNRVVLENGKEQLRVRQVDKPRIVQSFIAELEGPIPEYMQGATPPESPGGPVELDAAPQPYFVLPPRETAKQIDRSEAISSTIDSREGSSDNHPHEVSSMANSSTEPRQAAPASSRTPEPPSHFPTPPHGSPSTPVSESPPENIPLPLSPAEEVHLSLSTIAAIPLPFSQPTSPTAARTSDPVDALLLALCDTSPASPIHARHQSDSSIISPTSHLSSRTKPAPPPPAPGGRPMVPINFSGQGEFDGERKRASDGSRTGWKAFFTGEKVSPRLGGSSRRSSVHTSYSKSE